MPLFILIILSHLRKKGLSVLQPQLKKIKMSKKLWFMIKEKEMCRYDKKNNFNVWMRMKEWAYVMTKKYSS